MKAHHAIFTAIGAYLLVGAAYTAYQTTKGTPFAVAMIFTWPVQIFSA